MITEQDLRAAIAECQGVRNPNANTCLKLASYYTILEHLNGEDDHGPPAYSFAPDASNSIIDFESGSEFSQIINGQDAKKVLEVIDELMDTLRVVHARLYDGVIRKLT